MNLLPFDTFEINTTKKPSELMEIISTNCEERKFKFFLQNSKKPFIGWCKENQFKLHRAIAYRNSFLPIVLGKIIKTDNGSKIRVLFRMNFFVLIFMTIWFSGVLIGLMAIITKPFGASTIIPFLMLIFGYLLAQCGFWYEAKKAKNIIEEIIHDKSCT